MARCWHLCAQLCACIGFSLSLKFTLDGQCMCLSSSFLDPFHFLLTDINKHQKVQTVPSKITPCSLAVIYINDPPDGANWSSPAALALIYAAARRQSLNTAAVPHFLKNRSAKRGQFPSYNGCVVLMEWMGLMFLAFWVSICEHFSSVITSLFK